jgi:hypothetical protein
LTARPNNSQDDDFLEDMARERLQTLIDGASRSTPTSEQLHEAGALEHEIRTELDRYQAFITSEITPLQRELTRIGTPLDLSAKPPADPRPGPDVDERGARRSDDE